MPARTRKHSKRYTYNKGKIEMKIWITVVVITGLISVQALAQNPRPNWKDSYSVDGKCYCDSSNFDHNLDQKTALTPIGELNVVQICSDIEAVLGSGPTENRIPYNDIQCGNGPANDAADEAECPGRVDIGTAGCNIIGPKWDLASVYGGGSSENVQPSVNFTSPSNGDVYTLGENPVVDVSASDDGGISNVKLFLDNVFVRQENASPYRWSNTATNDTDLKNLSPGTYTLTAIAEDDTGFTSEESITFSIQSSSTGCDLPYANTGFSVSNENRSFNSGQIDISCADNVTLSMDIEGVGSMESADILNVFYEIDGESRVSLSENVDAFPKKTVSVSNLSGDFLELIIDAQNSSANETYTVSDIRISIDDSNDSNDINDSNDGEITNLSIGKSVTQSSLDFGGDPQRATDGNTSGIWNQNSVTHTENESQPWWQIDLGSISRLSYVNVWNRTNCCGSRLSNFYVLVSDTPFSDELDANLNQAGVSHFFVGPDAGSPTRVDMNLSGRFVRIQLAGSNPLSLAEVEILGTAGNTDLPVEDDNTNNESNESNESENNDRTAGTSACDNDSTIVNSIADLLPLLDNNNAKVQLAPGTYRIDTSDVDSGLFPNETLLSITSNNSTFCFTGATIEFDTKLFQSYGNVGVTEIYMGGSNNVLKNLTMVDIGNNRPSRTALGIQLDGSDNLIEGVHMTVRGSQPYAYGDLFGKGSGYVIKHFKHAAILLTGTDIHLKDTTVIHRAYGHGIFAQGAVNALVEGAYVEGEVRTTDDILAEEGSGSAADNVDFITVDGSRVTPGYTISLQEDGIRAYNSGGNGRNTENMRVIDSTVVNMRSGVVIGFADGEKYVENCTVLGNETGFSVGSGAEIVNSRGDAIHGPLYADDYGNNRNNTVDLTVLNNSERFGKHTAIAYIGGSGHNFTFKNSAPETTSNLSIMLGGLRPGPRHEVVNPRYNDLSAANIEIENLTDYPVILAPKASSNSGLSGGNVTDNGSRNDINEINL